MNRRTLISFAVLVLLSAVTFADNWPISRLPYPKVGVNLNKTITNADSDLPELSGLDSKVRAYMQKWELKGACVAVMRNDSLVFAKGYGKADEGVPMQPYHLMRVASVSKLSQHMIERSSKITYGVENCAVHIKNYCSVFHIPIPFC